MQVLSLVDSTIKTINKSLSNANKCCNTLKTESKESTTDSYAPIIKNKNRRSILMIPGPIEFDSSIYAALSKKTESHVSSSFIEQFGQCLERVRAILLADKTVQPFILSGGGSLGWDCLISSLLQTETMDRVLLLNTGYFSDSFRSCLNAYEIEVDEISATIGDVITPQTLEQYFIKNNTQRYAMIGITHVDTSVAIVNDICGLAQIIRKYSPNSLIAVDGVCSFAAHEFRFSEWDIDCCMSASQKAFGAPPGLCILALSERALNVMENRTNPIHSWYCSLMNWLPIMRSYEQRKVSYFSTPNVNLICALNVSCELLLDEGMEVVFARHKKYANAFQCAIIALGLDLVAVRREISALTISAFYFPANVNGKEFLAACKEYGCIFAGGLHRKIKGLYFRVGHMGISLRESCDDLFYCVQAIEYALHKCGYEFERGVGVKTFKEACLNFVF